MGPGIGSGSGGTAKADCVHTGEEKKRVEPGTGSGEAATKGARSRAAINM